MPAKKSSTPKRARKSTPKQVVVQETAPAPEPVPEPTPEPTLNSSSCNCFCTN